ncbi:beta-lactamase family protein [Allokutzneria sp. A3M-2-11 16]|uniref:serine hydrolase domain-containing protein n=1 Tax=Allokutzneria sp. A3M-2-11 16 TaxID=2962043 RepID=UPI0020B74F6C|nr:serine hydrolase domain-containing protein [Allokutzneria sp. A3M-2-11 16]MCP3804331.1 beta-lactamase family protein [Allokutzneria sp. A3M-2-11 16]
MLASLCASHQVPSAQLVVRDASGTTSESFGTAADTAFPLGSLTKPFTAALAMILVEDGEISLDEPLSEHLPDVDVTLRQVLSHTAGFASNIDEDAEQPALRSHWFPRYWRENGLVHPPGTVFSYSNVGYIVAGHLIEVLTGMDWAEAVAEILLRPLGISVSGRETAEGHTVLPDGRVVGIGPQSALALEDPNGGLALSASDLLAAAGFCGEMVEDQLDSVAVGPFGMADGWGLGWARYGTWWGHDGTSDGTSCHFRFDPRSGHAVALTTNASTGLDLWQDLVAKLGVPDYDPVDPGEPVQPDPWAVGRYVNGPSEFVVSLHDGTLVLAPDTELTCYAGGRFTAQALPGSKFVLSGRFLPDSVQLSGRLARRGG